MIAGTSLPIRTTVAVLPARPDRFAEAPNWIYARRMVLVALALAPLLTPWVSPQDDGPFIYPLAAAAELLSAISCWLAGGRNAGARMRWRTVALAQLLHTCVYLVPVLQGHRWLPNAAGSWFANVCASISWMLFFPAVMGTRIGRGKWVRALDGLLAALCCVLLTAAMGSGGQPGDGMSRVTVNLLTIASLAAAALAARHAGIQSETRRFCTVMSLYLCSCLGVCFLLNVVNLVVLPRPNLLASDLLIALPELMLCEWTFSNFRALRSAAAPWVLNPTMIDSLQPAILALGGVSLALYGLRAHSLICAGAVVSVMFCYATRTQLFYLRLFHQEKQLRTQATIMERLAAQDALTGIGNRRWFDETAEKLLGEVDRQPCSVLLIDTDRFKQINDTFGHEIGDQVLHAIAAGLQKVTSRVHRGCCARIGGDEFAALLPGVEALEAAALAEGLQDQIESHELQAQLRITVSVGIATTRRAISLAKLMRSADTALYQVKANQRNAVRWIEVE